MGAAKIQIVPLRPSIPRGLESSDSSSPPTDEATDKAGAEKQLVSKQTRTSKPKVRTGCVTCKIRRVKCDEIKPECSRCTSTGRKCDGYYIPPRKNRRANREPEPDLIPGPEACLEVVHGTPAELRAMEYFQQRTGPNLSSYFDAAFWTRLVLQVAHVEPAIRHAMVAVGTLNQQRDFGTQPVPMLRQVVLQDPLAVSVPITRNKLDHNDPFALGQYNKAINLLARRLRDPDAATEIALLACILFVCIEFLRGDVEPAIKHFKSGMGIIMNTLNKRGTTRDILTMERIRESMLPFFNRLELLAMLFGQDAVWDYPTPLNRAIPAKLRNVTEARDSIVHLMNLSLRFIREMKWKRYSRLILPDDIARLTALQQGIEDWATAMDELLLSQMVSAKDLDAAKVLRIHQMIMRLWLGTSIHAEERSTDDYMNEFEASVSLAEAIQRNSLTSEQRQDYQSSFLFDMEIVSPIYYVGIKCRHPQVRRRAIAVLRQTERREGLWDSNMAAAIAERIMSIEEANLSVLDGTELPEERHRIHNTHIQSMAGVNPFHHKITLYAKPHGMEGAFEIWQETIELEHDVQSEMPTTGPPMMGPTRLGPGLATYEELRCMESADRHSVVRSNFFQLVAKESG